MSKFKSTWKTYPKPFKYVIYSILGVLGIALLGLIFGLIIQVLWNWLMPEIFGLGKITYWQGLGLFILGRILFGRTEHNKNKVEVVDCCSHNKKQKSVEELKVTEVSNLGEKE